MTEPYVYQVREIDASCDAKTVFTSKTFETAKAKCDELKESNSHAFYLIRKQWQDGDHTCIYHQMAKY